MDDSPTTAHTISTGGIAGTHPPLADAQVRVAPATAAEQNLVTSGLIPVACWRVDDVRFDFDSSFVRPEVGEEIQALAVLRDQHKQAVQPRTSPQQPEFLYPPISIFGHADPVGNDSYNKLLSGRRAAAIYGLLTRRTDVWEDLFGNHGTFAAPAAGDKWGDPALQTMQQTTGLPAGTARATLFRAYMDSLCTLRDGDGKPLLDPKGQPLQLQLDPVDDFLARNKDSGGKGDFQGCGEFNPLLIFSSEKARQFQQFGDNTSRNLANAPNRRVMVLLFRPGSKVKFSKWPCPRAKEDVSDCHLRFWSDGEQRRSKQLADKDRQFQDSQDTFACRFYQRLSTGTSPCHKILQTFRIRLYDTQGVFIKNARCRVTVADKVVLPNAADDHGLLTVQNIEVPNRCVVEWGPPTSDGSSPPFPFRLELFLNIEPEEEAEKQEAAQRLNNIGYPFEAPLEDNVAAFQNDFGDARGLRKDGVLDDATMNAIREVHDTCADKLGARSSQS